MASRPCVDGQDHDHGIVPVQVHVKDHGIDHDLVNLNDHAHVATNFK
jgi:hypothetical protein